MQDAEVEAPGYDFDFVVKNNGKRKGQTIRAVVENWNKEDEQGLVYQTWAASFLAEAGKDLTLIHGLQPFGFLFRKPKSDHRPQVAFYLARCLAKALANVGEVYVVNNIDEPDPAKRAIGWVCIDPNRPDGVVVVHYVFIKPEYNKSGAARWLLAIIGIDMDDEQQPIRYTFKPDQPNRVPKHWGNVCPSIISDILEQGAPWFDDSPPLLNRNKDHV